ncbi:MAG: carboxypeptidase regulatory-like domain-containing protein [Acidobacteriota bacterium]
MKFGILTAVVAGMAVAASAQAGTIHGKVSGAKGESVVYLQVNPAKSFPAPTQHPAMNQKGLMFEPHILVVQQGTTVEFVNSDTVAHNVFWPSINGDKKLGHNMGTWPQGEKRSFTFSNAGVIPLLCNVHPDMSAFIIVSPTPYFATTDAAGNYEIKNVPDGSYTMTVWHEGKKPQTSSVTVSGETKSDATIR